jgi:hypothetical protein
LRYVDDHYVINDGSSKTSERVKIDILALGEGRYRVNWVRVTFKEQAEGRPGEEIIETYGQPGWLVFERDQFRSWQLVEDGIGNPAAS